MSSGIFAGPTNGHLHSGRDYRMLFVMDAQRLIADLIGAGLSQTAIADAVGMSQGGISRLASGDRKRISYETGERLVELHGKHAKRRRAR